MFIVNILIVTVLFYDTPYKSLGILIGYMPGKVYVPSYTLSGNLPISFNFVNSCDECLCHTIMLRNNSFVAINCLTNSNLCMLYTSYATNFEIQLNSTAYLYLFQPLPQATVSTTTPEMSTIEATTIGGSCSPPSSGYIAMFTGAPSSYQFYSYLITGEYTGQANLNFIFQGDSVTSWHLDDISLTIVNRSGSELLVDGGFEDYLNGWTLDCWANCDIGSSGFLATDSCHSGSLCYIDSCTGGYDFLYQSINITFGYVYNLSFWLYLDAGGSSATRAYITLQ